MVYYVIQGDIVYGREKNVNYRECTVDSSGDEGKDNDNDVEFKPTDCINLKKQKMTTKRKNGSKRKGWSDVYTSRDVSLDTDYISEDSNTESNIILPFKKVKYLWISELKEKHHSDNFKDDHLVMIPGYSTQLSDMTLSKFLLLNKSLVQGRIGEVITIPRNLHGQIYIVAGLQSTLHFSLSTADVKFLQDICNKRKVPFITLRNTDHSKKNFPERSTTETE